MGSLSGFGIFIKKIPSEDKYQLRKKYPFKYLFKYYDLIVQHRMKSERHLIYQFVLIADFKLIVVASVYMASFLLIYIFAFIFFTLKEVLSLCYSATTTS